MWFFTVLVLVMFPFSEQDECTRSVSMPQNGYVNVALGQSFNLTCTFTCFTGAHRVQLWRNKQLLSELSLSSDCPESKHTIVLFLLIPAVHPNDMGQYKCQDELMAVISSVTVNVLSEDTDEPMVTDQYNVTGAPTSEVKSTCSATASWNVPLWYLLAKMVVFLICSLSVVLKKIC